MSERIFLIDGLAQIFRCYYAPFRALTSPAGEPTRATFVFTQMLLQLIREQKPDYLAMVMDSDEAPVFRESIDTAYKAHREPPPEDLAPQIRRILEIVRSQDIPVLSVPGFEADDLLATISCQLSVACVNLDVLMVSKDKDLDQVLTDRVKMFDAGKSAIIGPTELMQLKGYTPAQAVEVQTLCGDSTDNIPGIKGVGPKKAAALIAKYGTADNVIAHADELTPAMRENVKAFAHQVAITRQLVTLRRDVPMTFDLASCRWTNLKHDRLLPIFKELGFGRLADQFADLTQRMSTSADTSIGTTNRTAEKTSTKPEAKTPTKTPLSDGAQLLLFGQPAAESSQESTALRVDRADSDSVNLGAAPARSDIIPAHSDEPIRLTQPSGRHTIPNYILVDNSAKFFDFLAELKQQPSFAFDTETDNLNPVAARLAGMSFSWKADTGYYLPILGIGNCLSLEPTLDALRPIMTDPNVRKIGQNLKYDLIVMRCHGVEVAGAQFDTMIASFVLDSSRSSHGMNSLARELLGFDPIPITDVIGKGSHQIRFDSVETNRQCEYAAEDADVTWQLAEIFQQQLAGSKLEPLFCETEMPLVEVLAAMEFEGVRLDTDLLAQMSRELGSKLDELQESVYREVGFSFNLDSPKQLAEVLFDHLKLPVVRKTKTGRSTDSETLETLAFETGHRVPELMKEYREVIKLKGTYIDTLPKMICPRTGRVHAGFNQTSAITGRLSSSDPNLQNIPIRTDMGRRIREAFVARDADHVLLTADYSQIELRVLAHFCGDAALKAAFEEDHDIHQFVAAQVFNVPIEAVSSEQRSRAKAVNFGIIYGQTAFGLSRGTGMSVGDAEAFIQAYFKRYPGIQVFIESTIEQARQTSFVQTILGRRRAISDINSRNKNLRSQAERLATNTVIQGSAADLIKRAMINIHRRTINEKRLSRMIIQVHDELVFDVPRAAIETEAEFVRHEMTTALPLNVPIKVDLAWGSNWSDSK
ncbi:MAG: DNA polymerase I [Phycisphaerae bacterium]|nr:DNA polymerase I [Phycisphaerae bacterium]